MNLLLKTICPRFWENHFHGSFNEGNVKQGSYSGNNDVETIVEPNILKSRKLSNILSWLQNTEDLDCKSNLDCLDSGLNSLSFND